MKKNKCAKTFHVAKTATHLSPATVVLFCFVYDCCELQHRSGIGHLRITSSIYCNKACSEYLFDQWEWIVSVCERRVAQTQIWMLIISTSGINIVHSSASNTWYDLDFQIIHLVWLECNWIDSYYMAGNVVDRNQIAIWFIFDAFHSTNWFKTSIECLESMESWVAETRRLFAEKKLLKFCIWLQWWLEQCYRMFFISPFSKLIPNDNFAKRANCQKFSDKLNKN